MKKLTLTLTISSLLILNGCSYRDIDKRFFVVAMGIDKSKAEHEKYKVSLKLSIPTAEVQPGKANSQIISQDADSISEAIRVMESEVDKKFDFGHCRVLIFDEKLLRKRHQVLFNWFFRRRDIQGIAYVAIGKPTAEKIIKIKAASERLPANALVLAFDETTNTSPYITTEILNDYFMRIMENGIDPFLPIVEPGKETYKIDTAAVIKDKKIAADLGREETRMLNELLNRTKMGQISVNNKKESFFVNVESFNTKMKVYTPPNQRPFVNVNIKLKGFIEEADRELNRKKELQDYEKTASMVLEKRIVKFLTHLQKLGVDPYGLELKYQAKHGVSKDIQEAWTQIFKNLEFRVKVDMSIKGTGTMF